MEVLVFAVRIFWGLYLLKSVSAFGSFAKEAAESIQAGSDPATLRTGAMIQGMWMYGGFTALVFWNVWIGLGSGIFFALFLRGAASAGQGIVAARATFAEWERRHEHDENSETQ